MKRHHLIFILSVLFVQYGTAQKNSEKYFKLEPLSPDSLSIDSSGYPYVRELSESHPMVSSLTMATTESLTIIFLPHIRLIEVEASGRSHLAHLSLLPER